MCGFASCSYEDHGVDSDAGYEEESGSIGETRVPFLTLLTALLKGTSLRGSISPRVPLILALYEEEADDAHDQAFFLSPQ